MYKRKSITIQFIQQGILLLHNNLINKYELNSVDNYKVINKSLFIEELQNILNQLNINKSILTNNINIIIDNTYSEVEKELLENIFKELSFNKIKFLSITKILKLTKEELLIDISLNNIKIYYLDELLEIRVYFSQYIQNLSIILKKVLTNPNIKVILLFGNNCNNKIISQIEQITSKKVYIYSQPNLIPIQLFT